MSPDDPPADGTETGPLRPFQDVWLKPRKVFRQLESVPVGPPDYFLSAAQGIVGWLAFSRMQNLGASTNLGEVLLKAATIGAASGIVGVWVQAYIYTWLGRRAGGDANRAQVIHVLAYGSVPLVVSLAIWLLACALLGAGALIEDPGRGTDAFVAILMRMQVAAHLLLMLWSGILQIMGLSEVHHVAVRGALGTWLLGQVLAFFAMMVIVILMISAGAPMPNG